MFEFSFIKKYLTPQRKQLSVSLIALLSVAVITLVVWLVVVFLSVTEGLEKSWIHKLTALNAPLRLQPTQEYFSSYYYNVDKYSAASRYLSKTIGQKAQSLISNPYDPEFDEELPSFMAKPDLNSTGELKDPIKGAMEVLEGLNVKGLTFQDVELSGALLRLDLVRQDPGMLEMQSQLTNVSYLASFPEKNPYLSELILPPRSEDLYNLNFLKTRFNLALSFAQKNTLPQSDSHSGMLIAKNFRDNGVRIGDRGYLAYSCPSIAGMKELHIPVYVAGFYDPGIMAVGSKCILVPSHITRAINASESAFTLDRSEANNIFVWFPNLSDAPKVKAAILQKLQEKGIAKYWKVQTYHDYEFAKDLMQQFQSDKYLFTLIAMIILVVACTNIISLLVLLVSDKKKEIGILRAMGAKRSSIGAIFAFSGASLGLFSCMLGLLLAFITLQNIDHLVAFLSFLQGHEAFNTQFFGQSLPHEISHRALVFVAIATPILALVAGLFPAIKAARLNPCETLRSE